MKNRPLIYFLSVLLMLVTLPGFGRNPGIVNISLRAHEAVPGLTHSTYNSNQYPCTNYYLNINKLKPEQLARLIKYVVELGDTDKEATDSLNTIITEDIKLTVERLIREMEDAFTTNDMMKVVSFYDDNGEILADDDFVKGSRYINNW